MYKKREQAISLACSPKNYIFNLLLLIIPRILNKVGVSIDFVPVDGEQHCVLSFDKYIMSILFYTCLGLIRGKTIFKIGVK